MPFLLGKIMRRLMGKGKIQTDPNLKFQTLICQTKTPSEVCDFRLEVQIPSVR